MPHQASSRLDEALKRAADSATAHFEHANGIARSVDAELRGLATALGEESVLLSGERAEALRVACSEFSAQLRVLQEEFSERVLRPMADRRSRLEHFTLMLFGRTLAGKSTLMEALTRGNGIEIGIGTQNTTVTIEEYEWEGLRVVDTPGIEGLGKGPQLAQLARAFVDEADAIVFVCVDDAILPADFESLAEIRDQNKPTWFVLNVKHADLEELAEYPEFVFRPSELDGHIRRIESGCERAAGLRKPKIMPLHAQAAFCARRPETAKAREWLGARNTDRAFLRRLESCSQIGSFEEVLTDLVAQTAPTIRAKAAHESLVHHLSVMRRALVQTNRDLREYCQSVEDWKADLRRRYQRIWDSGIVVLGELRHMVEPMKDDAWEIAREAVDGTADPDRWLKKKTKKLAKKAESLQSEVIESVNQLNAEFVRDVGVELEALQLSLKPSQIQHGAAVAGFDPTRRKNWTRMGTAIVGGALTVVGTVVLIGNPVGWAVIGAGALFGVAGDALATLFGRRDSEKYNREVGRIAGHLRKALWTSFEAINDDCYEWMKRNISRQRQDNIAHLQAQADVLHATRKMVRRSVRLLDNHADAASARVVHTLFHQGFQFVREGHIEVSRVARDKGRLTKVVLRGDDSYLGAVIGRGGESIKALEADLGDRRVDVCMEHENDAILLLRILRVGNPDDWHVEWTGDTWLVRAPTRGHSGRIPGGLDLELASRLIGAVVHMEK